MIILLLIFFCFQFGIFFFSFGHSVLFVFAVYPVFVCTWWTLNNEKKECFLLCLPISNWNFEFMVSVTEEGSQLFYSLDIQLQKLNLKIH